MAYKTTLDLSDLNEDDDDLTDDEVFIRGGKSIPSEANGVSKPLMAPRNRTKAEGLHTKVRKVPPLRVLWGPFIYGLIALGSIIGIICLVIFLVNTFILHLSRDNIIQIDEDDKNYGTCTNVTVEDVWYTNFPMLTTESAFRLVNITNDDIPDIVFGFGTGADAFHYPRTVCDVYFNGVKFCGGGLGAIDGKTGKELWRFYTEHEIFAVNCEYDLTGDHINDCLAGGRMAGFYAVNGLNGTQLWQFNDLDAKVETSNVYTPQYINDLDGDGIPEVLVIHGGDPLKEPGSKSRLIGRLLIVSGKTGEVWMWTEVPDKKESYYSPQVLTYPDGSKIVLFGTGGETHGGSLWYISLTDLINGKINMATAIYTDKRKGIMTPPVLVDITGDLVPDVVMAMFNSNVVAFDGLTFKRLWNHKFPQSESYSTPGAGYFNTDKVPDFIVNYQTGPGFPIYYYTQTSILDGNTGKPLLKDPIKMVVGTQSSPLVVSVDGYGNDIFLYWVSDCHGTHTNLEFDFVKGTSVHEQSRSDFCKLRFKENLFTRLYAMTRNIGSPGVLVYDSDLRKSIEYANPINYTEIGQRYKEQMNAKESATDFSRDYYDDSFQDRQSPRRMHVLDVDQVYNIHDGLNEYPRHHHQDFSNSDDYYPSKRYPERGRIWNNRRRFMKKPHISSGAEQQDLGYRRNEDLPADYSSFSIQRCCCYFARV